MPVPDTCPDCGSDEVVYRPKTGKLTCDTCSKTHIIMADTFAESDAVTRMRDACHKLARATHWIAAIENVWPAPIAHEYYRLRTMLLENQPSVANVVWQLKDFAEVLLKFPTLVIFRELYDIADDAGRRRLSARLLKKPLSMGDWADLSTTISSLALQTTPPLHTARLAKLFRRKPSGEKANTALSQVLAELVAWRNDEIGHGAFRLDQTEYLTSLQDWIARLNNALAEHYDVWDECILEVAPDSSGSVSHLLAGWQTLGTSSQRHDKSHRAGAMADLYLRGLNGFKLLLTPYITYRHCSQCGRVDLFFFDSYKSRERKSCFLDYYRAHKTTIPDHQQCDIAQEYQALQQTAITGADTLDDRPAGGEYAQASMQKLLEECQLQAKTITPDYLRDPLRQYLESNDRGIYWLKASGHVGKTTLVSDLVAHPSYGGVRTCAFHIKREYRTTPAQFAEALRDALKSDRVLNIAAGTKALPDLPLHSTDPQSAFVGWLTEMRDASSYQGKLLICIDGLDELPTPDNEHSIADYIPTDVALPEYVFLLLTSRPLEDCPSWLSSRLGARLTIAADCTTVELDRGHDAGYRALMRQYFYARLRLKWEVDIAEAIAHATPVAENMRPANSFTQQQWAEFAADEKLKTHAKYATSKISAGNSSELNVVLAVFEDYEDLFGTLLEKSDHRFLFFGYLVDTIESTGNWRATAGLPGGEELMSHLVRRLYGAFGEDTTDQGGKRATQSANSMTPPNKNFNLALRTLHLLAAAEEAVLCDNSWRSRPQAWRGLQLSILARLLNEDSGSSADQTCISNRLVFVLYTLKSVLRSDKSDTASDARFSLGLDMGKTVRALHGREVDECHARIATEFLLTWRNRYGDIPEGDLVATHVRTMTMAHVRCSTNTGTHSLFRENVVSLSNEGWLLLANRARADGQTEQMLEWLDRLIEIQRVALADQSTELNFRANTYLLYVRNCHERVKAISALGGRNNALRATAQLVELRRDVLLWFAQPEHQGPKHFPVFVELCDMDQQIGYRYRMAAETEADLGRAMHALNNFRTNAGTFITAELKASGTGILQKADFARLYLTFIRADVEFATCRRLQRDWKVKRQGVRDDEVEHTDQEQSDQAKALQDLATKYLDEAVSMLDDFPVAPDIISDISQLRARINQERMRLEGTSLTQLKSALADVALLRQVPVERRSSNYANDLAARLNDVGMAYQALNDPLQAATYFRDAVALVRTFMGQNCASRLKLAQVLGNQFAAEVQQLLALSLESGPEKAGQKQATASDTLESPVASCAALVFEIARCWDEIAEEVPRSDWPSQWLANYDAFKNNAQPYFSYLRLRNFSDISL